MATVALRAPATPRATHPRVLMAAVAVPAAGTMFRT